MSTDYFPRWLERSSFRPDRQNRFLKIAHVSVFVRDQNESLKFYIEQLGFRLLHDRKLSDGNRWIAVAPPDGSTVLTLLSAPSGSTQSAEVGRHTGIVLVTEDVEAQYNEWSNREVRFSLPPSTTEWGGTIALFEDIDHNEFALVGFDSITREIERERRFIAEQIEAEQRALQEMAIAKEVQARLFPQAAPHVPTLDYAGTCIQARHVGGDYYDFLDLGRNQIGLVMADISGKGIAGALLMANLQANLRSQSALAVENPRGLIQSVNRLFYQNTRDSSYATLFFALYDDGARRLRYANCGHLSGLLLRQRGTLERLDSTSTVIGLFPEFECAMEQRTLCDGDVLLLYTDGVTECMNDLEEEFGEARLAEVLHESRNLPVQAILDATIAAVREFSCSEQQDDITLLAAKCRPGASR